MCRERRQHFVRVSCLGDDGYVTFDRERFAQAAPDQRMVVHDDDGDHNVVSWTGSDTLTVVPRPGALVTVTSPPNSRARSRIPIRPSAPSRAAPASLPLPS